MIQIYDGVNGSGKTTKIKDEKFNKVYNYVSDYAKDAYSFENKKRDLFEETKKFYRDLNDIVYAFEYELEKFTYIITLLNKKNNFNYQIAFDRSPFSHLIYPAIKFYLNQWGMGRINNQKVQEVKSFFRVTLDECESELNALKKQTQIHILPDTYLPVAFHQLNTYDKIEKTGFNAVIDMLQLRNAFKSQR